MISEIKHKMEIIHCFVEYTIIISYVLHISRFFGLFLVFHIVILLSYFILSNTLNYIKLRLLFYLISVTKYLQCESRTCSNASCDSVLRFKVHYCSNKKMPWKVHLLALYDLNFEELATLLQF